MKHRISIFNWVVIVVMIITATACSSGKKALERGNYYQSVITAVEKLRRSPGHKKSSQTLKLAYPLALEYYEQEATNGLARNDRNKWQGVLNSYTRINTMYEEIRRSPGAQQVIPNPKNYYDELAQARENAAEESYQFGLTELAKGTRQGGQNAYRAFSDANSYVDGYKDVLDKMEQAYWAGTLKVLIAPIPVTNARVQLDANFFEDKIHEYLKNQPINEFVRFMSEGELVNIGMPADHVLQLSFDEFTIGEVYTVEKQIDAYKDSVKVGSARINTGGTSNSNSNSNTGNLTNQSSGSTNSGSGMTNNSGSNSGSGTSGNTGNNSGSTTSGNNTSGSSANTGGDGTSTSSSSGNSSNSTGSTSSNSGSSTNSGNSGTNTGTSGNTNSNTVEDNSGSNNSGSGNNNSNSSSSTSSSSSNTNTVNDTSGSKNSGSGNNSGNNASSGSTTSGSSSNSGSSSSGSDSGSTDSTTDTSSDTSGGSVTIDTNLPKATVEICMDNKSMMVTEKDLLSYLSKGASLYDCSAGKNKKVRVCHNLSGKTLEISVNALKSHLAHGDKLGGCDGSGYIVESGNQGNGGGQGNSGSSSDSDKVRDQAGGKDENVDKRSDVTGNKGEVTEGSEEKETGKSSKEKKETKKKGNNEPMLLAAASLSPDFLQSHYADTVIDVYQTVRAKVFVFEKTVRSYGTLDFKIIEPGTQSLISAEKLSGEHIWMSQWGYFNGDERALTDEQLQIVNQREQQPPREQDMFIGFTAPIFDQLMIKIRNFYNRY